MSKLFVIAAALGAIVGFGRIESARAQTLNDSTLRVNTYVTGFDNPTGVAFLDSAGTALVTEKDTGKVKLVQNRKVTATVLDLPVANDSEHGLLSVALSPTFASDHFVYLYHSAAARDGGEPVSNKISRYVWDAGRRQLVFERKVIDLPPGPGPNHNGGKIAFAPNGKLFAVVGDLNHQGRTQNFEDSSEMLRTGVILRLQPNGGRIATNPFATNGAKRGVLDDVWAYGIRNSFGLAFDPVGGQLWDTENGPTFMDEVNRVPPGFNSGWKDVSGPASRNNGGETGTLVNLGARAKYVDPQMSWATPVAPTDLEFVTSSRLGGAYRNDLLMGDVNTGSLYHFDLSADRNSLALGGALADKVADNADADLLRESGPLVLGGGFGVISDLANGPGGMFVTSLSNGAIYRITENIASPLSTGDLVYRPMARVAAITPAPEPAIGLVGVAVVALYAAQKRKR